ncbi:MAG: DUF2079 domain-containing protein [Deltaproteobacteria bacterium]|nr:DUF2079 domain-containing protein [Deltaproteobacteria bacterium]
MTRSAHAKLSVAAVAVGAGLAWLAFARYASFHNETFDLALYARMAWGLARWNWWEPIVGAHVWGIHISPVLVLLGLVGRVVGTVPTLLVCQVVCAMATAWPLARIGARRLGPAGAFAGVAVWFLYPSLSHVLSYEFHPVTLAVLPLAWGLDALDRKDSRGVALAALGMVVCREDTALVAMMLGVMAAVTSPSMRRTGVAIAAGSLSYFLVFAAVLVPMLAPEHGSIEAHFGQWGNSFGEVLWNVATRPARALAHVGSPQKLGYLALLLAPVAFLPLRRPSLLVVAAAPIVANLLSRWPTTTSLDSHYQIVLVPILVVAALDGLRALPERLHATALGTLVAAALVGHVLEGGTPISVPFDWGDFGRDTRARAAQAIVDEIPTGASVQAPYAFLPHLAERIEVHEAPPGDRGADFVVLDAWHRQAWAHSEDLLRTDEEPLVRRWLAREDLGLVAARGPYLLLKRGAPPRGGLVARYLERRARRPEVGTRLSACIGLRSAWVDGDELVLELVARGECPSDLAIRIGASGRPQRVDPLFDGLLSPAHLERGDLVVSRHRFDRSERERWSRLGVRVGLLRSSGARPAPEDPASVKVPLPRGALLDRPAVRHRAGSGA